MLENTYLQQVPSPTQARTAQGFLLLFWLNKTRANGGMLVSPKCTCLCLWWSAKSVPTGNGRKVGEQKGLESWESESGQDHFLAGWPRAIHLTFLSLFPTFPSSWGHPRYVSSTKDTYLENLAQRQPMGDSSSLRPGITIMNTDSLNYQCSHREAGAHAPRTTPQAQVTWRIDTSIQRRRRSAPVTVTWLCCQ